MGCYVPQRLFDELVVHRLMADLSGKDDEFDELVQRYRHGYPDEDIGVLIADVTAAATQSRELLMQATNARHEMAIFQGLLVVLEAEAVEAAHDKPLWRRIVENFFFNMQPKPIPHRVETACAHLAWAQRVLQLREMQLRIVTGTMKACSAVFSSCHSVLIA